MPRIVSTLEFAARAKDKTWQMMTRVYEQAARVINEQINPANGWNPVYVDPATNLVVLNHDNPKNKDNLKGAVVYCTFTAANTDTIIRHNLGYVPRCYIPLWKAVSCDVYDGNGNGGAATPLYQPPGLGLVFADTSTRPDGTNPYTTVTTSTIPLRSTVATNVLLLIF